MAQNKPAHEIRLGRIRAAIWANENGQEAVRFNVTVSRLYNDGGAWKDSQSFGRDDLPVVAKVMDMAYAWIWNRQTTTPAEENPNASDTKPYFMLGAGELAASVWKSGNEKSGWHYRFTIFRMSPVSGRVSVTRLYRNGDVWKESTRFGRDDIPPLRFLLDAAHTWIYEHGQSHEP